MANTKTNKDDTKVAAIASKPKQDDIPEDAAEKEPVNDPSDDPPIPDNKEAKEPSESRDKDDDDDDGEDPSVELG